MAWLNFQIFCRNKNRGLAPRHSLLTAFAVGAMAAFRSLLDVPRLRAGDFLWHGFCCNKFRGLAPTSVVPAPCPSAGQWSLFSSLLDFPRLWAGVFSWGVSND